MPIIFNAEIGDKKESTQLVFGTGDIGILVGYKQGDPSLQSLIFHQSTPKPVEEWHEGDNELVDKPSDVIEGEIVELVFSRPESIDSIISQLEELKEKF